MKTFTVRLPKELIKKIKAHAVANDVTCQDLVRSAIEAKIKADAND